MLNVDPFVTALASYTGDITLLDNGFDPNIISEITDARPIVLIFNISNNFHVLISKPKLIIKLEK